VWVHITDEKGETFAYTVTPQACHGAELASVRLVKWVEDSAVACYRVTFDPAGLARCSCPGHTYHHHCKHVRALTAAGLLRVEERQLLQRQQAFFEACVAELEAQVDTLRRQLAEAAAKKSRPRRKAVVDVA
jgi:hypothetical protein